MHGTFDGEERAWKPCSSNAISVIRVSGKRANDAAQADWLLDYEIKLIDNGDSATDLAAAVERLRSKLAERREELIVKWHRMVARGGKGLQ
jgi:hypothetical protein